MAQTPAAPAVLVPNNGGGMSFAIDDFARLRRFLILGAEGGSYYVRASKLAFDNATAVVRLLNDGRGLEVVKAIVEISTEGRAAKQTPGLMALALCSRFGDAQVRSAALAVVKDVCRTASTLAQFLKLHAELGSAASTADKKCHRVSWGRAMRRAVANWYLSKDPMALAYQVTKYGQREGWSQRDLLRLAHPNPVKHFATLKRKSAEKQQEDLPATNQSMDNNEGQAPSAEEADGCDSMVACKRRKVVEPDQLVADLATVFTYVTKQGALPAPISSASTTASTQLVSYLTAAALLKKGRPTLTLSYQAEVCDLIKQHRFTWEHIGDTGLLKSPVIWTSLLQSSLPLGALLRNLGRMTAIGVFNDQAAVDEACSRLTNEAALRNARLHPLVILEVMRTYATGSGEKGSLCWWANASILAALDKAFYLAFKAVQPTGKRYMVALDVSGSMSMGNCAGMRIMPSEAGAALTMALLRCEPNTTTVAFSYVLTPLDVTRDDTLEQAMHKASAISMGATDCSAPMVYAKENGLDVDVFVVITDNETNCNRVPPHQALVEYRAASGIADAKLLVLATTASGFSIADPNDAGMLDVAGLDSAVPQMLRDFAMNKL